MEKIELKDVNGNWAGEAVREAKKGPWALRWEEGETCSAGTQAQAEKQLRSILKKLGVEVDP